MSAVPHTAETAPGITVATSDAEETRALGARLARLLRAGDLVMLSGGLGAGKTTLAQGIGAALEVRGRVSSPTFIIARVHPALSDGPDLIHVTPTGSPPWRRSTPSTWTPPWNGPSPWSSGARRRWRP